MPNPVTTKSPNRLVISAVFGMVDSGLAGKGFTVGVDVSSGCGFGLGAGAGFGLGVGFGTGFGLGVGSGTGFGMVRGGR